MRPLFLIPVLLFSAAALAQEADPMANFPAEAITTVKQPQAPATPETPKTPAAPVSEIWPATTVPVFMVSCTQGNKELSQPCRCVIDQLMRTMKHNEFIAATQHGGIDQDPRYVSARAMCLSQPKRK